MLRSLACGQFVMERLEGEAAEKEAVSKAAAQENSRKAASEHSAALQASHHLPLSAAWIFVALVLINLTVLGLANSR